MRVLFLISLLIGLSFAKEVKIKIEKMHCPLCTTMIKKAVKKVDGIQKIKVLLNIKTATINYDENKADTKKILDAIKTTGYEGVVLE